VRGRGAGSARRGAGPAAPAWRDVGPAVTARRGAELAVPGSLRAVWRPFARSAA
jgi:hypothetical protein